ncbi:hypothetical protein, partial [Lentimicrobium sp.]|uniref:hypothetical protein n=1 Tax=Lentimicrobium sp. TaxID=2034841 RepID=UPI00345E3AC9
PSSSITLPSFSAPRWSRLRSTTTLVPFQRPSPLLQASLAPSSGVPRPFFRRPSPLLQASLVPPSASSLCIISKKSASLTYEIHKTHCTPPGTDSYLPVAACTTTAAPDCHCR